ncbi:hypothetical protein DICA3_C02586 [Diutina catenulata]
MSDLGSDTEPTKEARLEAARKKFEAMRAKKKAAMGTSESGSTPASGWGSARVSTDSVDPFDVDEFRASLSASATNSVSGAHQSASSTPQEAPKQEAPQPEAPRPQAPQPPSISATVASKYAPVSTPIPDDVEGLRALVAEQKNTIAKLRSENTDLKLEQMDLNDRIAELEEEVRQMNHGQTAAPASTIGATAFDPQSLEPKAKAPEPPRPAEPTFTSNDYASGSQADLTKKMEEVSDFREKLMLWKGWQVDMTQWGGVAKHPTIKI